jgi:Spy/CpxP family protein refolding chaperone
MDTLSQITPSNPALAMNSSLRWKVVLAFVLVFLAGIACGFFGAARGGLGLMYRPHSGSIAEHMRKRLETALNLTPEQVRQISPIIESASAQLEAKREQTGREVRQIFEQAHSEIEPFLTAEQRAKLEKMEQRHRRMPRRHGLMPPPPP